MVNEWTTIHFCVGMQISTRFAYSILLMMLGLVAHGFRLSHRRLVWSATKQSLSTLPDSIDNSMEDRSASPNIDISKSKFGELGLNENLLKGLAKQGKK